MVNVGLIEELAKEKGVNVGRVSDNIGIKDMYRIVRILEIRDRDLVNCIFFADQVTQ